MPEYIVKLNFQFPAWDETDGLRFFIDADSKADAIREARALARDHGHTGGGKGRATFTANVA